MLSSRRVVRFAAAPFSQVHRSFPLKFSELAHHHKLVMYIKHNVAIEDGLLKTH